MATWPTTLPDPLLAGYTRSPQPTTLRTPMDVGPAKVRRRATTRVEAINFSLHLTSAQRATLETFFRTTLEDGALTFDWVDHDTGAAVVYSFVAPPVYTPLGADRFTATLQLELQP